jgi:hypothetical protein
MMFTRKSLGFNSIKTLVSFKRDKETVTYDIPSSGVSVYRNSVLTVLYYFIQMIRYMLRSYDNPMYIFPLEDGRTTKTCSG